MFYFLLRLKFYLQNKSSLLDSYSIINNLRFPTIHKSHLNMFRLKITHFRISWFFKQQYFLDLKSLYFELDEKYSLDARYNFVGKSSHVPLLNNYFTRREAEVNILPSSVVETHKIA